MPVVFAKLNNFYLSKVMVNIFSEIIHPELKTILLNAKIVHIHTIWPENTPSNYLCHTTILSLVSVCTVCPYWYDFKSSGYYNSSEA